MPAELDPTLSTLVSGAVTDVRTLIRGEIELAKAELNQSAKRGARGGGLVAVAVFLALFALLMLAFAAAYGLVAAGLSPWAAFLIVAGVMLALTAGLGAFAVKEFKKVSGPTRAQQEIAKTQQLFADRAAQASAARALESAAAPDAGSRSAGPATGGSEPMSATVFPSYGGTPPAP